MINTLEKPKKEKIIDMIKSITDKEEMRDIYMESRTHYKHMCWEIKKGSFNHIYIVRYNDLHTKKELKKEFDDVNKISSFFRIDVGDVNRFLFKSDIKLINEIYEILSIGLIRTKCSDNMNKSKNLVVNQLKTILINGDLEK